MSVTTKTQCGFGTTGPPVTAPEGEDCDLLQQIHCFVIGDASGGTVTGQFEVLSNGRSYKCEIANWQLMQSGNPAASLITGKIVMCKTRWTRDRRILNELDFTGGGAGFNDVEVMGFIYQDSALTCGRGTPNAGVQHMFYPWVTGEADPNLLATYPNLFAGLINFANPGAGHVTEMDILLKLTLMDRPLGPTLTEQRYGIKP